MIYIFKKIYGALFSLLVIANVAIPLSAEDYNFEGKESEYTRACFSYTTTTSKTEAECEAFEEYLENKQSGYKEELADINSQKEDIESNVMEYVSKIEEYENEIASIDEQIAILEEDNSEEIDSLEDITEDIKEKMELYQEEKEKLATKLIELQAYLGTNYKLKYLASATSLYDYDVRRIQLQDFYQDDVKTLEEIYADIEEYDDSKSQYVSKTEQMEKQKQLLSDSKSLSAQLREQAKQILAIYKQQEAEIVAEYTHQLENVDEVKAILKKSKAKIANLAASTSWISPIKKGEYSVSAGVWNYPESFGGGVHLGIDLAAVNGTEIVAPANGVVLFSANACSEVGAYGNLCGAPGAAGGGNQVYLLTNVSGRLFAVSFAHMEYNSVVETGTVVHAGDVIGKVGSTGNSTGNHTHMEMFYLGDAQDINSFIANWDGDFSFGNSWGNIALENICTTEFNKSSCRIDGQAVMGL